MRIYTNVLLGIDSLWKRLTASESEADNFRFRMKYVKEYVDDSRLDVILFLKNKNGNTSFYIIRKWLRFFSYYRSNSEKTKTLFLKSILLHK